MEVKKWSKDSLRSGWFHSRRKGATRFCSFTLHNKSRMKWSVLMFLWFYLSHSPPRISSAFSHVLRAAELVQRSEHRCGSRCTVSAAWRWRQTLVKHFSVRNTDGAERSRLICAESNYVYIKVSRSFFSYTVKQMSNTQTVTPDQLST